MSAPKRDREQLTGAFRALEEDFRDAGAAEMQRQPARSRRYGRYGRRALGPALGGAVAFLAVAGVSIGTAVLTADDGRRGGDAHAPAEVRHAPGDVIRGAAVSEDPAQRGKLWGVAVYPSANRHETCVLAGTIRGATLGRAINGKFASFGKTFPGGCDDMRRNHFVLRTRDYCPATGSRTILFGVADRVVTRMQLGKPGALRGLAIARDGTFIAVKAKPHALTGYVLRIEFAGAAPVSIQLQPARRRLRGNRASGKPSPPPSLCP